MDPLIQAHQRDQASDGFNKISLQWWGHPADTYLPVIGLRFLSGLRGNGLLDEEVKPDSMNSSLFVQLINSPQVEIVVGATGKRFLLPRDLLTWVSPFFKRGLSDIWQTQHPQHQGMKIEMRAEDEEVFGLAVILLVRPDYFTIPKFAWKDSLKETATLFIRLAILGEFLLVPMIGYCAAANLKFLMDCQPPNALIEPEHVSLVLENLTDASNTKTLVMERAADLFLSPRWTTYEHVDIKTGWKFASLVAENAEFNEKLLIAIKNRMVGRQILLVEPILR